MVPIEINPIAVDRFTRLMREQLVSGDVAARKAYLSAIVDTIVVSDTTIRIIGSNDNIRATLGPNGQPTPAVRKSVQEWCPATYRTPQHPFSRSAATLEAEAATVKARQHRLMLGIVVSRHYSRTSGNAHRKA